MTESENGSETPPVEPALKRFIETLTPEEKSLVGPYLRIPDPDTLSDSFDALVEEKSDENKDH